MASDYVREDAREAAVRPWVRLTTLLMCPLPRDRLDAVVCVSSLFHTPQTDKTPDKTPFSQKKWPCCSDSSTPISMRKSTFWSEPNHYVTCSTKSLCYELVVLVRTSTIPRTSDLPAWSFHNPKQARFVSGLLCCHHHRPRALV